jgi:hypothetical protein
VGIAMMRFLMAVVATVGLSLSVSHAQEPAKEEKKFEVPPPTPVTPQLLPYYLPSSLPQPGTREIWQYYGVDSRGRWVPRVILSPSGAYYYYNGAPYRYTTTQPNLYMPYAAN